MFSILITTIAIALIAALALATLYYGGSAFKEGAERAQVSKLIAQGQQILGAMEVYRAEQGVYPVSLAALVSTNYLKAIPVANLETKSLLTEALASQTAWSLATPGSPVLVLSPVSVATCKAYNKASLGAAGVLYAPHIGLPRQCYGTDVNTLTIVQAKTPEDLQFAATSPAALVQIGPLSNSPAPNISAEDTSIDGWFLPPDAALPGNKVAYNVPALEFPSTLVGTTSSPKTVVVTNISKSSVTFASPGAQVGAPFTLVSNTCSGAVLAPQASCQVEVAFAPASRTSYSGVAYQLTLQAPGVSLPGLSLSGTGSSPVAVKDFQITYKGESVGRLSFGPDTISAAARSIYHITASKGFDQPPAQVYPNPNYDNQLISEGAQSSSDTLTYVLQNKSNDKVDFNLWVSAPSFATNCGQVSSPMDGPGGSSRLSLPAGQSCTISATYLMWSPNYFPDITVIGAFSDGTEFWYDGLADYWEPAE